MENQIDKDLCDKVTVNSDIKISEKEALLNNKLNNPELHKAINNYNNMNTVPDFSDLNSLRSSIINSSTNDGQTKEKELHIVTINNFFIESDPMNGIALIEEFKKVISNTNQSGFDGLAHLFHYGAQGKRFKLSTLLKDRLGNSYYWGSVSEGHSTTEFKIPYFQGLDRLIKNTESKIQISVQLKDILELIKSFNN